MCVARLYHASIRPHYGESVCNAIVGRPLGRSRQTHGTTVAATKAERSERCLMPPWMVRSPSEENAILVALTNKPGAILSESMDNCGLASSYGVLCLVGKKYRQIESTYGLYVRIQPEHLDESAILTRDQIKWSDTSSRGCYALLKAE